ncbi:MAG: peptide deformylase [Sulfuricurvum sp. PC08-66]|nr:MAG: peptide deformylase [Sulfuricurvum sp. PC08-66]
MIRTILEYPHPTLKQRSTDVTTFDETLHTLLDDMFETMLAHNGIGLAAIQVAQPVRALIIGIPNQADEQLKNELLEIINPTVVAKEGTTTYQEGCLSVPGFYEDVERSDTITITYQDRHGSSHTLNAEGLLCVAIQHEMDHLNGKLFIEHLSYGKRKKFEKELKKSLREKKNPKTD